MSDQPGTGTLQEDLSLRDFRPRPALIVPQTLIARPCCPVIDAHNHLGEEFGGGWDRRPVPELLDVLDAAGVRMLVDLDGGWGEDLLQRHLDHFKNAAPERFRIFGGVDWSAWPEHGDRFGEWAAARLRAQAARGAEGLKIWKALGLHVRDQHGARVPIDDPRLDPVWAAAGELNLPVVIHIADPVAFFDPLDGTNERWEELHVYPEWHFPGPAFPPFISLLDDLAAVVTRNSQTTFVGAHVGCYAENLDWVSALVDRCPNFYVDLGARLGEIGRQPNTARRFFLAHPDRILFGTDCAPQVDVYRLYYRFLETDDDHFNYDISDPPGQGRWRISGINLPRDVLEQVYFRNAERVMLGNPPGAPATQARESISVAATPGSHTRHELFAQPAAWDAALAQLNGRAATLREFFREGGYDAITFTGCGSTYYASIAAADLFCTLGLPARALPGSELWLSPLPPRVRGAELSPPTPPRMRGGKGGTLLVAVSRSGETTETVRAVEAFQAAGLGDVLTLSCYPGRPLTALGAVNLIFPEAQEESVAQTRAFSTLYLAAAALGMLWAGRDDLLAQMAGLPAAGRRLLDTHAGLARDLGRDPNFERFYFLGSGPRYGLACELSLKMKEMSLSHSEPFHVLEFRHGPQSMVTRQTLIVALLSQAHRAQESAVLAEMRARGARVLTIGESESDVAFASGLDEAVCGALYLPLGQYLAFEHALGRGLDPDSPHNLTAVVTLP